MRPAAPYPAYYIPEGVPAPAHMPWVGITGPQALLAETSPDHGEGMYWGTSYDPISQSMWQKSRDGWYVLLMGHDPGHLARYKIIDGPVIVGAKPDHYWMVPQLLRWHPDAGLISAIPEVFKDYEWGPPAQFRPMMERLRAVMLLGAADTVPIVEDEDAVALAISILAINYHVSEHELALSGWLNTDMVRAIISAAGGLDEMRKLTEARTVANGR